MTNIKRSIALLLATMILSAMLASEVHGNTQNYEEPPWIKSYVDSLFAEQALGGSYEPHLGSNRESGTEGSSQGPSLYAMPYNGMLVFTVDDTFAWSEGLMDDGMTKIAKFLKEVARHAEEGLEDSEDRKKE